MDAGLETQERDAMRSGVFREVIDQQLTILAPPKCRPDVHALQLSVLPAEQLDPTASRWRSIDPQHEERHAFFDQSIDAEPVTALRRIERLQVGLQLVDQTYGVGSVGSLRGDNRGWHRAILPCVVEAVKPTTRQGAR